MCSEKNTSHRYRSNSLKNFISVSNHNHFAVLNCSTPDRVSHQKLDWYFRTNASSTSPRVIWQRGRSNIDRYIAYSPDQYRHFLQIKPLHSNDSGIYMCIDQTTGFFSQIELYVCMFIYHPSFFSFVRFYLICCF